MRDKLKAAGIHLALSALVIAIIFGIIFLLWYPAPWFKVTGTNEIIWVLIGVDLVLGPALTLLVYKKGKKRSKPSEMSVSFFITSLVLYN